MPSRLPCPSCNSRKGLAIYDDHDYCHACKEVFNKSTKLIDFEEKRVRKPLRIPTKFSQPAKEGIKYLNQFQLNFNKKILWSLEYDRICFRFRNAIGTISMWMRDPVGNQQQKWLLAGEPGLFKQINEDNNRVVLVEDVISCIKVGAVENCIALCGTNINSLKAYDLPETVILWFDHDKAGFKAVEDFKNKYALRVKNIGVIRTKKDPKYYTLDQIRELLNG
jgi:hypothetical protein